jgi:CRP/FNR family transcriptional regulator
LNNCSDHVVKTISDKKIFRHVKRGEKIFTEGKEVVNIAFIKSGVIKVEVNGKKDRPLIMRLVKEGEILGHRIAEKNDHPVSVIAVENSQVCYLSTQHFQYLMEECADFRKEIIKVYLQEMKHIETRAIHLVHKTVREKIAGVLLHIAEVYNYKTQVNGIRIHLTRQEIADLTGSTKEQVSKVLMDFKKEKLIKFRAKHFQFFDIENLKKVAVEIHAN